MIMKRFLLSALGAWITVVLFAVPAYRGWQTRTLNDGTPVTVRQIGDEFFHYWETQDGQLAVEQKDGSFVLSDKALPSPKARAARRAAAAAKRQKRSIGDTPNLAPRGIVIVVNFADTVLDEGHTLATFDELCNSASCTVNAYNDTYYGSAAQYFDDQSNGAYRPVFDVFGPVTLPHGVEYYGEQKEAETEEDETINDLYIADFVIDAVEAAEAAGCDFSPYDSDDDGYVDFVYFIFAGKGQASGGGTETIWPHNWSLLSALYYGYTHGTSPYYWNKDGYNPLVVDDKIINSYACSSEKDNNNRLDGIGTLCHEFGHVMGLPDLYETDYGYNYDYYLTPSQWDIMDMGSYNGGGHCPPNYNPWEKHFFGWTDLFNPGEDGADITLVANGEAGQRVCQINASGTQQAATESGLCYYLENRQKSGWDSYVPSHGLVIWRVDYDAGLWAANEPNNTDNEPRLTIECSSGTMIGVVWEYNEVTGKYDKINDGTNNVFGEEAGVFEWEGVPGRPVTEISDADGLVSFKYMGGAPEILPWELWEYYDDGTYETSIGTGGESFYWAVMFPAYSLEQGYPELTKIAIAETPETNTQPIEITIYEGGDVPSVENKIYTQTVAPEGTIFHVVTLDEAVSFDRTKNLWIVLSEGTDEYPALVSNDTGDPNGRWCSLDGIEWSDLVTYELNYTYMLRAFFRNNVPSGVDQTETDSGLSGKFLHNGQLIILRDGKTYTVLGTEIR